MRILLGSSSFYILGAAVLIVSAAILVFSLSSSTESNQIAATVTRGDVTQLVSVSGVVEAENTAQLAFPVVGIVASVRVDEGELVDTGEILATLEQNTLLADRKEALASLAAAKADLDELKNGPRSEARDVTDTTVSIKQSELTQTTLEEEQKIANARRTLLSTDLEATAVNPSQSPEPPTITGTYTCETEGDYNLDVYSSKTVSGYSFHVTGLEIGTYSASVQQPRHFGACGLKIQFDDASFYNNTEWTIAIPNTQSSSYVANLNAYELTKEQAESAIDDAKKALALAEQQQTLENATPRSEALIRAEAAVTQAEARLDRVNAQIADRTLRAPFSGVITDVTVLPGETVGTTPVITLLADSAFELTARIPEIDITKVSEGQNAAVVFDAQSDEELTAVISYISPLATEIDGVAYYEATLTFPQNPTWFRSGLNADIDIIVEKRENVSRLPRRYISETNGTYFVTIPNGENETATSSIEVGVIGNDGFVEVIGLSAGDTVLAP